MAGESCVSFHFGCPRSMIMEKRSFSASPLGSDPGSSERPSPATPWGGRKLAPATESRAGFSVWAWGTLDVFPSVLRAGAQGHQPPEPGFPPAQSLPSSSAKGLEASAPPPQNKFHSTAQVLLFLQWELEASEH